MLRFILLLMLMGYCLPSSAFAGAAFSPWKADVKIADENIMIKHNLKKQNINVYNSPQGGTYFLIRFFQIVISPQDGPSCRFHPTCSNYGRIAILRFGAIIGAMLAGDRIIRCNPYSAPGEDPVPESIIGEDK